MPDLAPLTQLGIIGTLAALAGLLAKMLWEQMQTRRARPDDAVVNGWRPEAARLARNLHEVRDIAQAAILRTAVVETKVLDIVDRLGRIEGKIDRVLER